MVGFNAFRSLCEAIDRPGNVTSSAYSRIKNEGSVLIRAKLICGVAIFGMLGPCASASAVWWGTYGSWDSQTRKDAADAALLAVVNRLNSYGDFNAGSDGWIDVYYDAAVPTANASWAGAMTFGGTWPGERVALHESNHWLGSIYGHDPNIGPRAVALLEQFDGVGARFGHDSQHFWPYGMNYDSEWSEVGAERNVAIMYAFRADWSIGPTSNPTAWAATSVTLSGSDAAGESGFNFGSKWSDHTFAHGNANYSTGAFDLRTPQGYPSWKFAGNSLTVNSGGRLLFNGWGTTGVVTIKNLTLDGGTIKHDQFSQDLFQLGGNITLAATSTIDAANGDIKILAPIGGNGSLNKAGTKILTLAGANTYSGATNINAGTLRLAAAPVASYTFDNVSGNTVVNSGNGGAAMNGTLAGGATIVAGGQSGSAVNLAGGASVDINNPITDLGSTGSWTVSAWVKTTAAGASILNKGDGANWVSGNTTFYLGDGSGAGTGGIPGAVRWGGGFLQQNVFAPKVNDGNWHLVTYVNNGGSYAIFTDGVARTLSPGNTGFSNGDIGSIVRLGIATNPGDGAANFNGLLDNVQVYNQALTAAQITALYQGQSMSPLPTTTMVTIASGATFDLNGLTQQIASLSGALGATVALGAGQLIINSSASTQFSGVISGAGGSLVKDGTDAFTVTGSSTYSGGTTIRGGTLRVSNLFGSGTGSGAVAVLTGGTLGGTGTIGGAVTVNEGGRIAPGASVGNLKVGSLNLAPGSILDFEFDTVSNADVSDLINVTAGNGLTINGGLLNITNLGNMTAGTYTLLDYVGDLGGSLASISFGSLPTGFDYQLVNNMSATSIDLIVSTSLLGDYNSDGAVDAADYVLWRKNPPAYGDSAGYDVWRQNFGNSASASASSMSAAVPEPAASSCISMIAIVAALLRSQLRCSVRRPTA